MSSASSPRRSRPKAGTPCPRPSAKGCRVPRPRPERVAHKGGDAVPEAEREGLSRPAPAPKPYLDELARIHKEHKGEMPLANFVQAQQTWDRAMAQALAPHASGTLAVGIIGSGHLRHGYGVPLQLRDLGRSEEHTSELQSHSDIV